MPTAGKISNSMAEELRMHRSPFMQEMLAGHNTNQRSRLESKIDSLSDEVAELKELLKPPSALIITGADMRTEFMKIMGSGNDA